MRLVSLEKAPGRRYSTFQYIKGTGRDLERDFLQWYVVTGQGNGFKLKEGGLRVAIRNKLFTVRVEQVSQSSVGCPIPGSVPRQVG